MEASPLSHQARPSAFLPKIAQLYDDLFHVRSSANVGYRSVAECKIGQRRGLAGFGRILAGILFAET